MKSTNSTPKLPTKTLKGLLNKKNSDTVFIIGGGPSVSTLIPDTSVIEDRDIICTNNAYKLYPDALVLHFMDAPWWQWHQDAEHNVKENFSGEIVSSAVTKREMNIESNLITYFKRIVDPSNTVIGGLTDNPNDLRGNNSGHQAINIAYHMQYEQVVLIGFDLNRNAQSCHWHKDHRRLTNRDMFEDRMLPEFEKTAEWLKDKEMNVYNLNRKSAIQGFTFADLRDFI